MENELRSENANLRFENAKLKFETLYNGRPSTIRSFAFHGGLRIFYLVIGLAGLVASLVYLGLTLEAIAAREQFINYLQQRFKMDEGAEYVANIFFPVKLALSIALLGLSICFLIMARLCRKIVKRNLYIMDLETTWMDLKDN